MLRVESETGWWLTTHPDHARLAGSFAAAWGSEVFRRPEPRTRVLYAISAHDDGWADRDAHPTITRQGKPSAFSTELVGKYSAFEEIDLVDYLAVRERAVRLIASTDPYAALLIAMHTYDLLSERADRSTISQEGLTLLDDFLSRQRVYQDELWDYIAADETLINEQKKRETIREHFRLLQACDNLSLLSCVGFDRPASLLHPLPLKGGGSAEVTVHPLGPRSFRLSPWPFAQKELTFAFPARHVTGRTFESSAKLEQAFLAATVKELTVTLAA
ncbi:DUF3891 family protein [Acidobacteria bacterium AB60]|nr:DUF3891 family protein [Acidobacteria bacterium AB60]